MYSTGIMTLQQHTFQKRKLENLRKEGENMSSPKRKQLPYRLGYIYKIAEKSPHQHLRVKMKSLSQIGQKRR
jgi:hypothetical protein